MSITPVSNEQTDLCVICREELDDNVVTLACKHIFHKPCMEEQEAKGLHFCSLCRVPTDEYVRIYLGPDGMPIGIGEIQDDEYCDALYEDIKKKHYRTIVNVAKIWCIYFGSCIVYNCLDFIIPRLTQDPETCLPFDV